MNYNEIFEMLFVHDVQLFVILISIKHYMLLFVWKHGDLMTKECT